MKPNLTALQKRLKKEKLDFLLIESSSNRRYLTEFTGSAGILLVPDSGRSVLYVDSRYTLQAQRQTQDAEIVEIDRFNQVHLVTFADQNKGAKVGFESTHITHNQLQKLKKFGKKLKWVPTNHLVEDIRALKTASEIKSLKKALKIADLAFMEIKKFITPGVTEKEIAFKLEVIMKELGAEGNAWEPLIVATGKNSALPHHGHSKTVVKRGDMVQLDYGCVVDGYHTDTSRMVFIGQPNIKQKEIYDLVLRAQMLGISLIKSGVQTGKIDEQVKDWLRTQTTGVFKHGLGHGVGLEIHEKPTLYVGNKEELQSGQVITIEPGIYIEGWGGVRLEDMVLVTDTGGQVLTKASKKLADIIV